jgi:hypothetical protein
VVDVSGTDNAGAVEVTIWEMVWKAPGIFVSLGFCNAQYSELVPWENRPVIPPWELKAVPINTTVAMTHSPPIVAADQVFIFGSFHVYGLDSGTSQTKTRHR